MPLLHHPAGGGDGGPPGGDAARSAYRRWTLSLPLSLPLPLRWPALRTRGLLGAVERALVRAVWRWQRAVARRAGVAGPLRGGAVGFLQLFGSALQLTPHFHVLLPEVLWGPGGAFVPLPPPADADVEAVLHRVLRQLRPRLAALEETRLDDTDFAPRRGAQRLLLPAAPRPRGRRLAVAHGFSLHADTALHPHDRLGLEGAGLLPGASGRRAGDPGLADEAAAEQGVHPAATVTIGDLLLSQAAPGLGGCTRARGPGPGSKP